MSQNETDKKFELEKPARSRKKRRTPYQILTSIKPLLGSRDTSDDEQEKLDAHLKVLMRKRGKLAGMRVFAAEHIKTFSFERDFSIVVIDGDVFRLSDSQSKIIRYLFDQHLIHSGNVQGTPFRTIMKQVGIKRAKHCRMQNFFRVVRGGPKHDQLIEETFQGCWRLHLSVSIYPPTYVRTDFR